MKTKQDDIDSIFFIGKFNLKNQNDSCSRCCLRMKCDMRVQNMLHNHFYHLTAIVLKELPFVFLKKLTRNFIFLHALNYITLKTKIFLASKRGIGYNQIDLLIAICFVFLHRDEIYDNQTKSIFVRWQSETRVKIRSQ